MNRPRLVQQLLALPLFHAEWVLWLLLFLSVVSIAVMVERWLFYRKRRVDLVSLRRDFSGALAKRDYAVATAVLEKHDSLETNSVLFALRSHLAGPAAVEELLIGAACKERERYDSRLGLLANIASNAPFIGLFGTVLGIMRAFNDLSANSRDSSLAVMSGVAEALTATAVGLLVAIPALVAFNVFKRSVKVATNNGQYLARMLLAHLKSVA
jgi:biopolymer transport protein ExbB/TolQ